MCEARYLSPMEQNGVLLRLHRRPHHRADRCRMGPALPDHQGTSVTSEQDAQAPFAGGQAPQALVGQALPAPAGGQVTYLPVGQAPPVAAQTTHALVGQAPCAAWQATHAPVGQAPSAAWQATHAPVGQAPSAAGQAPPALGGQALQMASGQAPPAPGGQAHLTHAVQAPPALATQASAEQAGQASSAMSGKVPPVVAGQASPVAKQAPAVKAVRFPPATPSQLPPKLATVRQSSGQHEEIPLLKRDGFNGAGRVPSLRKQMRIEDEPER